MRRDTTKDVAVVSGKQEEEVRGGSMWRWGAEERGRALGFVLGLEEVFS